MFKKLSILSLALALASISMAQTNKKTKAVLLQNFTIKLEESLEIALKPQKNELNFEKYYRIVQFENVDKAKIGDVIHNATLLSYLPHNAYIVSIENNTDINLLAQALKSKHALSATPMQAAWKLSKKLYQQNIPEWAWNENKAIIVLKVYRDFNLNTAISAIQTEYIQEINNEEKLITLEVNPNDILNIASLPFIEYVQEMEDPGSPENYPSRSNHRVNTLQSAYPGASQYDGSGIVVGHGDDGAIGPHIDYTGRFQQQASASTGDHGDHVAGTIFGAGNLDPKGKGMAPGAEIYYQTYPNNLSDADINYAQREVRVTVSSYSNGCNAGYTNFTQQMDQDIIDNPTLLHIFSAGNDGTSNCGYGAGSVWGNVTGGHKIAKNVVAVANLSSTDVLASSSSRGPASDGRIKPDISAVGSAVYSTTNPNQYTTKSGTSMACPGVGGVTAVLYEAYRDHNSNTDPQSGLLKAILLNSADDLGNSGPDFKFGYGRINAKKAYEIIENQQYITDNISHNNTKNYQINVPSNVKQVKVMLYWSDLPGSTVAARALVNDLDLTANDGSQTYQPWVLDPTPNPTTLNNPAIRARDSLNNIEQITIDDFSDGAVSLTVNGFNIPNGIQEFYIVYSFIQDEVVLTYPMGGEKLVPGEQEIIRWDASDSNVPFDVEYSADNGANWTTIFNGVNASRRYLNWTVPSNTIPGGQYLMRISRGGQSSISQAPFTVINTPTNIQITKICPNAIALSWDSVAHAQGYVVYELGAKYMDSITYVTTTEAIIPLQNPNNEHWYSVAAVSLHNTVGRRALAIKKTQTGLLNCILATDIAINKILTPTHGAISSCYNYNSTPVTVRIENNGINPAYNFEVSYNLDNNPKVSHIITDTIAPGQYMDYTFGSTISFNGNTHNFSAAVNIAMDENTLNDSLHQIINIYTSNTVNIPYTQTFDSFTNCNDASDCGLVNCTLQNGWYNPANGTLDDIDWITQNGSTPSNNTGPNNDQNTGNSSGKYLYLEASGPCDSSEAILLSPCVNLSPTNSPILSFWYHMNGANIGHLKVDVFNGKEWLNNIMAPIVGSQGNSWLQKELSLKDFVGDTIIVRFRGKTGDDYQSDIALDNISIYENSNAPIADFSQNITNTCQNGLVHFKDASQYAPTSWEWTITPNTYQFEQGTNINSPNISITFLDSGLYDVKLKTTNAFGTDSITKSQTINAQSGANLPLAEDFETPIFPPNNWAIENPNNLEAWKRSQVIGSDGINGYVAEFDNYNGGASNASDAIVTTNLDLSSTTNPLLFFDVSYALANNKPFYDSLIIEVSYDCGISYTPTTYKKYGLDLATTPSINSKFIPTNANEWRRDTLDLSTYITNSTKIRFRNYSGGNNAIYIDNIQVVAPNVSAPIASFTNSEGDTMCLNQNIIFTDNITGGMPTSYEWDFGINAVPRFANTAGPITVKFVTEGTQNVTLKVANAGGFDVFSSTFEVIRKPLSSFNHNINGSTVVFSDQSFYQPTDWYWDFGDGDTAIVPNPTHTYTSNGTYTIYHKVSNSCGFTDRTQTITISGAVGIEESFDFKLAQLYPNPSKGLFNLHLSSIIAMDATIHIVDISGKTLYHKDVNIKAGVHDTPLDISHLQQGIYIVKLITPKETLSFKAFKQ